MNVVVSGLTLDSRSVERGNLFVALQGSSQDGRLFIEDAMNRGAVAVLVDGEDIQMSEVPQIPYSKLRECLGHIAARFFDYPSRRLSVIGVTGTNGKTTVTHWIAQMLTVLGKPCGVVGTLGSGSVTHLTDRQCTTPDPIQVQSIMSDFVNEGIQAVAMEVTSHAIHQFRIEGTQLKTGIYTNLTQDHLDYHQSMEQYWQTKKQLFSRYQPQYALVNLDDPHSWEIFNDETISSAKFGYSVQSRYEGNESVLWVEQYQCFTNKIHAQLVTPWGRGEVEFHGLGIFNLSNLLASIGACCLEGYPLAEVLKAAQECRCVPGRMMVFEAKECPLVVVDYAHTPDALEKALVALKEHCQGRIWTVFGCGGNRDRSKRALMGKVAERLSNSVILTNDNPRREDPKQIVQDILSGIQDPAKISVELDRKQAIQIAIDKASSRDIVLVAGKGHETQQFIEGESLPYSDIETVRQILKCN